MKKLTKRTKELIGRGAKMEGNFIDGYNYIEEELYCDEAEEIYEFCNYIDNEIGGAGRANYDILWKAFNNPDDEKAIAAAMEVKAKIAEIKNI